MTKPRQQPVKLAPETPGERDLRVVLRLAERARDVARKIDETEEILSALVKEQREILDKTLPDAMDTAGIQKLTLRDGSQLVSAPYVDASLPREDQEEGYAWLIAHDHGDIIKCEVSVPFTAGNRAEAIRLRDALKKRGLPAELCQGVHAGTLKKFAREVMETGGQLPDIFRVFTGTRAIIKRP